MSAVLSAVAGMPLMAISISISVSTTSGAVAAFSSQGFGKKNTQKKAEYIVDDSMATRQLLQHLVDVEECEGIVDAIDVGFDKSTHRLRGLYAKQRFANKGEYICAIPFTSTILLDESFYPNTSDSKNSDNSDNGDDDDMPVVTSEMELAASRIQNAVNFLQMVGKSENVLERLYRECLPTSSSAMIMSEDSVNFSPTPDFWTVEEIQELEVPLVVQELLERKEQVRARVEEARRKSSRKETPSRDDDTPDTIPLSPDTTQEELLHALWLVRSRAFTTLKKAITLDATEGLLQRTVLIPFLDFLNHHKKANVALEVVESQSSYEESFYALVAQRPIRKGEELTICYGTGQEASWEVYIKYGFWPSSVLAGHEKNDIVRLPDLEIVAPNTPSWTTTLEEDLEEQRKLLLLLRSSSERNSSTTRRSSILDFRIRIKQLLQQYYTD